jgi:ribulose bisphosphate carboxylase small subunit
MSFYIAPKFLDKLAVHITKNFMDLPDVRVPLILGIHGRKGEGKSFQCELVFEKMGVEVVHMSAGELESPDAGDPARLIRLRYREAAELIRTRGRMSVLMINDLDAGAGRFDRSTQYTVNTQLVNGTLMNIADNPTNVQLPGSYDETPLHRVPIIVTGNDFSTLYEPLIRDGRMEKFYWEPTRDDRIGIVSGIFEADGLSRAQIQQLVDTFPEQSIDFFGALRSRLYDEQVRKFIDQIGLNRVSSRLLKSTEGAPKIERPNFNLEHLLEIGHLMFDEQDRVRRMRLSREYMRIDDRDDDEEIRPARSPQAGKAVGRNRTERSQPEATPRANNNSANEGTLPSEIAEPLQQLTIAGYNIGIEFVDKRRFQTNSWKTCACIASDRHEEAARELANCLQTHPNDYVRIVGIEPQAKRRVSETIVQRPNR